MQEMFLPSNFQLTCITIRRGPAKLSGALERNLNRLNHFYGNNFESLTLKVLKMLLLSLIPKISMTNINKILIHSIIDHIFLTKKKSQNIYSHNSQLWKKYKIKLFCLLRKATPALYLFTNVSSLAN